MVNRARESIQWTDTHLPLPTGKNVFVGILDSGIDIAQAGLSIANACVWDQREAPPGNNGEPAPSEVLRGTALQTLTDPTGHGSAVASIIADNRTPAGIAPDATIRVVLSDGIEDSALAAIEWVFAQAGDHPAVVNISVPSMNHADPHDGTDGLSLAISELTGPGRIVCVAVGNHGMKPLHARLDLAPGEEVTIPFYTEFDYRLVPAYSHQLVLYSRDSTPFEFGITPAERVRPPVMVGSNGDRDLDFESRIVRLSSSTNPTIGRQSAAAVLSAAGTPPRLGEKDHWLLTVRASGNATQVDVWAGDVRVKFADRRRGVDTQSALAARYTSDLRLLARPSAAVGAIAVGAYDDRSPNGDAAWPHSATGPTGDERARPHFVLPGAGLDTSTGTRNGTSFATAMATGIIAGLLEKQPDLDPIAVRSLMLGSGSPISERDHSIYDPQMGCGIVRGSKIWKAFHEA